MKKIIREKYENGVLVSREIEATGTRWPKVAKLAIHLVIAVSLAAIAIVAVYDAVLASAVGQSVDAIDTVTPVKGLRS